MTMSSSTRKKVRDQIRKQTREIRKALSGMDLLVDGTLLSRTKTCGRPNCRCMKDPSARHGPYFEWTRRKDGRLVHSILSAEQAVLIEKAIANYREVQRLLADWHDETEAEVLKMSRMG